MVVLSNLKSQLGFIILVSILGLVFLMFGITELSLGIPRIYFIGTAFCLLLAGTVAVAGLLELKS